MLSALGPACHLTCNSYVPTETMRPSVSAVKQCIWSPKMGPQSTPLPLPGIRACPLAKQLIDTVILAL